jgi:TPP-dependent indolepyruvate ferredoxin oxidoreductase alpha subunit
VAKVPVLEPADAADARAMVPTAFALSERFHTPVMFRTTTPEGSWSPASAPRPRARPSHAR